MTDKLNGQILSLPFLHDAHVICTNSIRIAFKTTWQCPSRYQKVTSPGQSTLPFILLWFYMGYSDTKTNDTEEWNSKMWYI